MVTKAQAMAFAIAVLQQRNPDADIQPGDKLEDWGYPDQISKIELMQRIDRQHWHGLVVQPSDAVAWDLVSDVAATCQTAPN